jgi:uncharacterized protein YjbI with pentapeptide repeats
LFLHLRVQSSNMSKSTGKKTKEKTFWLLLLKALQEEWRIWLAIVVILLVAFLFSTQLAAWLDKTPSISAFIKVLDSLGKFGLLIAVITFLRKIPEWEERAKQEAKRRRFEYWQAVDSAYTAKRSKEGRFFSTALKIALEELAKEKNADGEPIKLVVDADGARLEEINLEGAYLYVCGLKGADLSGANLRNTKLEVIDGRWARLFGTDLSGSQFIRGVLLTHALYDEKTKFPIGFDPQEAEAYKIAPGAFLQGAMLENASLWAANLEKANLQEANLKYAVIGGNWRYTNLQNANLEEIKNADLDLRWANLQGANLDGARMKNVDVSGADLRGARNITVEQIKEAKNWEQAIYDNNFRQALGLSSAV